MSIEIYSFQYIFRDNDEESNGEGGPTEVWTLVYADGPEGESYDSMVFPSKERAKAAAADTELPLLWGVQIGNSVRLHLDEAMLRPIFTITWE